MLTAPLSPTGASSGPAMARRAPAARTAVEILGLRFAWPRAPGRALNLPALRVEAGETLFLGGPSGSGKSSLLALIGGINPPQQGRIAIFDTELTELSGAARDRFRADHLGIIFQSFNLLPYLSALNNVVLPCEFSPRRRTHAAEISGSIHAEAARLLSRLGLNDATLLKRPAAELSIGQQQRVAAARALIGRPDLAIADEPTSALDTELRAVFIELLRHECEEARSTLLCVSHDRALAGYFDRVVELPAINRVDIRN